MDDALEAKHKKSLGKEQGFFLGVMDASAPSLAAFVIIKTRYEDGKIYHQAACVRWDVPVSYQSVGFHNE